MVRGSAYAQIMRMCADNALSACIMRGCVFCADYAQMRIVRMCSCAVLRSVCICAACASAHVRCCAVCAEAETLAGRPQMHHFLRTLEREGESIKQQGLSSTREGNFCSMTFAKCAPAARFRVTQQKFSRPRANSEPLMRNAVTLDVLEHVRTCKFPIPAVRVDVRNPVKT